ncbi:hypothetical protein EJ110_NYTH52547 [Nymphaea thermarum]|nr:hypothetical protein EJ110_NYTH52547 [Nymphaea thermarum]
MAVVNEDDYVLFEMRLAEDDFDNDDEDSKTFSFEGLDDEEILEHLQKGAMHLSHPCTERGKFITQTEPELEPSAPWSSLPRAIDGSEFHVFLSFRGEDIWEGFIDHLHEVLKRCGINTFIDSENLEKGEEIERSLVYIKKSKIYVPSFSKA